MSPQITPEQFLALAKSKSVNIANTDRIIGLVKTFNPHDVNGYTEAERDCYAVIRQVPISRTGSTWGTTSDGVGGHVGLISGHMMPNRSGINLRWLAKLHTLIIETYL